jgi:stress response protein YsnF
MAQTVVGIFENSNATRNAVERLKAYGFSEADIDISDVNLDRKGTDDGQNQEEGFGDRIGNFFRNLFDNENDADKYSAAARNRVVVSVYADSFTEAERAADIMDEHGAINVNETTSYDINSATTDYTLDEDEANERSVPVIEEELQLGKREVETGGMRVRSRIIGRPVEENLRLRQERVRVDRTPANRPATESDLNTFREGEIEVRERSEEPVVNKQARVVEEVNVRKEVDERDEVVRETVRKSDVEVEPINQAGTPGRKGKETK